MCVTLLWMTIRLSEYQMRLLLGRPAANQPSSIRWKCGCAARCLHLRTYEVATCADHAILLREVRQVEDPIYESFTVPMPQNLLARFG